MSTIDERVVAMKFDGKNFEAGAQSTLSLLDKLKGSLKFGGATKGFGEIDKAAKSVNFSSLALGVETIKNHFSALDIIGVTALKNIVSSAQHAGAQLLRSFTVAPISEGFADYNEKLTSVQTIMNATGMSIEKTNGYFTELDNYADKTVYNLKDMTGAYAKFTNAGVDSAKSIPAIKGIANMTALAGQGASAASIAMYNLSQSIAGGFLTTTDYKSLNLANIATKEWKDQMVQGAVAAGKLKKQADGTYQIVGSGSMKAYTSASLFNDALAEGWASTDVILGVLGQYGDETTEIGRKALGAAQDVRSLPMMLDTLKASIGTGWTDTFETLIGNVEESKVLFTGLTDVIAGFIDATSDARNNTLKSWKELGGRTALIETFKNVYAGISSVIKPVAEAFREIFPAITGRQLADFTNRLQTLTSKLKLSAESSENLKRTFKGVFAIFSIAAQGVKLLLGAIGGLFGLMPKMDGSFLGFTAGIGDSLVALDRLIKSGEATAVVMRKIGDVVQFVKDLFGGSSFAAAFSSELDDIKWRIDSFLSMFTGTSFDEALGGILGGADGGISIDTSGIRAFGDEMKTAFGEAAASAELTASSIGSTLMGLVDRAMPYLKQFADFLGTQLSAAMQKLGDVMTGLNFDQVLKILGGAVAGAGLAQIIKVIKSLTDITDGVGGILDGVTNSLKAMVLNIQAKALLKIAGAILVLGVALMLVASIDPERMAYALGAITLMFGQLIGTLSAMNTIMSGGGTIGLAKASVGLIALSVAILLLSFAVKKMSGMNLAELAKGLGGLTLIMGLLIAISKNLSMNAKGLIRGSLGLIVFSVALRMMVNVVEDIGAIDTGKLIKGILGLTVMIGLLTGFMAVSRGSSFKPSDAVAIVILVAALKMMFNVVEDIAAIDNGALRKGLGVLALVMTGLAAFANVTGSKDLLATSAAMILIALALGKMVKNIEAMAALSYEQLFKGLGGLAGALAIIVVAAKQLDKKATGNLMMISGAMAVLAAAMKLLGSMSLAEIGKSLIALAGGMAIMALSLRLMPADARSSAGIMGMAIALAILVPVLKALGRMSLAEIAKGLGAMAGVMVIMGAAGYLLGPVAPVLMALAGAVALFGLGAALAGAGTLLFAMGLTALAASGVAGAASLVASMGILLQIIPLAMIALGEGIIAFAGVIAAGAPAIVAAIVVVLLALIAAIRVLTPVVLDTLGFMLISFVEMLVKYVPEMVDGGMRMIQGILKGIADNIGKVIDEGVRVVTNFIDGVASNLPKIVASATNLIITFIEAMAQSVRDNKDRMNTAGLDLAAALADGLISGIVGAATRVATAAWELGKKAIDAIANATKTASPSKEAFDIGGFVGIGLALGMVAQASKVSSAGEKLGVSALDSLKGALSGAASALDGAMDTSPIIRPVLDLSEVASGARNIGDILGGQGISAASSYTRAIQAAVVGSPSDNGEAVQPAAPAPGNTISYVQNNYSPKPLSRLEIYRLTRNQLAAVRGAVSG